MIRLALCLLLVYCVIAGAVRVEGKGVLLIAVAGAAFGIARAIGRPKR